jgi:HAE1 family hydrophobic/amphiphilic exporter-1
VTLSDLSIRRPVTTWMMTAAIVLVGGLGYVRLGVDQFPSMEFPVVSVTSNMEGASPEVMEEDVTDVLEEYLNTVPGLRKISSITLHGISQVGIEFELNTDINVAAQDVRDKIALARIDLPFDLEPPVVAKVDTSNFPIVWVPLITERPIVDTSEYTRLVVKPNMQTIPGVGAVEMFGRRDRNVRIWMDGEALHARGLSPTDVVSALRREHVEMPGGRVEGKRIEYSVTTDAEFDSLADMERLVVAYVDGAVVRLEDVARVEDGSEDPRVHAYFNRGPSVGVGVLKQPGGNTVAIADQVYERLDVLNATAPTGISFGRAEGLIDFSLPIREAVAETQFALVLGAILATLTVFVFLRRWRPTMIVGAAIPLSLIGAFGAMWLFGFTLNVMTLLALALAVGVVIDDAIVVLENIERHREQGEDAFEAASKGTKEIAFAATAATVSIAVVFLPVIFATGIVGNFLREFGGTVAAAVMISLFVALTLTPMLAARMPPPRAREHGSIYHRLEMGFEALEGAYRRALDWTLEHRALTMGFALLTLLGSCGLGSALGREFFPPEDQGRMIIRFELPPGSTIAASRDYMSQVEDWVFEQADVQAGFGGLGIAGPDGPATPNMGLLFVILKPRAERDRSAHELFAATRSFLDTLPDNKASLFGLQQMTAASDHDFSFDIRGSLPLADLERLAEDAIAKLAASGGYNDLDKSLKMGLPEVRVVPNRDKAAALGVDAATLAAVVQAAIGGLDVGTFKEGGRGYDIRVRLEADARDAPETIGHLYARGRDGRVVELRNLVDIVEGAAPATITRTGRQRSVEVRANLDGKPLGEAMRDAQAIAADLPDGVSLALGGNAESMAESAQQFTMMLVLAIIVIYMVLAVQFESFVHPLTVMLALPLAMVGAMGGLYVMSLTGKPGMTLNLFSLIGIILLFGLVTKNSILLVDYANQLRARGMDKVVAMRTAAPLRMRPVLMTAISMIFGVLPAALGLGPGSETRAPMGVATAAGMFSSTLLTLLVVPVFYLVLDDGVDWLRIHLRRGQADAPAPGSAPAADAEREGA